MESLEALARVGLFIGGKQMGIMLRLIIMFIVSVVLLIVGYIKKNMVANYLAIGLLLITFGIGFRIWMALGNM